MLRRIWNLRRHLRFSLGTLVLFVLLLGSIGGLWYRWEPWAVEYRFLLVADQWPHAFFAEDGKRFLIADGDRLAIYATNTGQQVFEGRTGLQSIFSLGFLPDGKRVLAGSLDGEVQIWSIQENRKLTAWRAHETKRMWWGALTRDGSKLITAAADGAVAVWETATGRIFETIRQGPCLPFTRGADLSNDLSKIAVQFGEELMVFDVQSMRFCALHTLEPDAKRTSLNFSRPSGI